MSGLNGQFNARLQRVERLQDSATEVPKPTSADAGKVITVNEDGDGYVLGEGGGGGGLVEIKNVEPFQVPDLVNGGTRLFNPANDSLYIIESEDEPYHEILGKFIVSKATPPGILYEEMPKGLLGCVITLWLAEQVYEIPNATNTPQFCVTPSTVYRTVYRFQGEDVSYCLINPENIAYRYTANK